MSDTTRLKAAFLSLFLLVFFFSASVSQAHLVSGTVLGPNGSLPGVEVRIKPAGTDWISTLADGNGRFSIDVNTDTIESMFANPAENTGLMGKKVDWFDISGGREMRLFVAEKVAFEADLVFPDGVDASEMEFWLLPADRFHPEFDWSRVGPNRVEGSVAAGSYTAQVFPRCTFDELGFVCPLIRYFSSVSFEARPGETAQLVVPVMDPAKPRIPRDPPVASLISISPPNEAGLAVVSGAPGAAFAASQVVVVNLQTGHYGRTISAADGSFSIQFLAPPGAWLEVRHDPTRLSYGGSFGAGTLIRAPIPGQNSGAFATMRRAYEWTGSIEENGPLENFGVRDSGQIWLTGQLTDRHWARGETIDLNGTLKIYLREAGNIDADGLNGWGTVYLERVFDPKGKQERANPVFMSSFMTPTGMPIERRAPNYDHTATQAIPLGGIEFGEWSKSSPTSLDGTWSAQLQIPATVPDGVYSLVFEPSVDDITTSQSYFDGVFPQYFDTIFSLASTTLVTIGDPEPGRLSWVLALNEFSDGSRGIVALEDRAVVGIAGRQTANTSTFILPRHESTTGAPLVYRLEPFVPLIGAGNRSWITPPTVDFAFPSGSLSVQVIQPDGTVVDLGSAPFAQPFVQQPAGPTGNTMDPGNHVGPYFGLTTGTGQFDFSFTQYGRHRIEMRGSIDDVDGNTYTGGGTYELFIARRLDLETGTFAGTPFEVNDAFAPSVIVQPGVEADVRIEINHYPESDPARRVHRVIEGRSNRYGYFHPNPGNEFVFTAPGEYRVDITASHRDEEGVLWMGSESWASVAETPNSSLIARGQRNRNCSNGNLDQWVVATQDNICGTHLPFPYHTGDIAWSMDTDVDPFFTALFPAVRVLDTGGQFAEMLRARFGPGSRFWDDDLEKQIAIGEIPLVSSTTKGIAGPLLLDDPETHVSYFYSTAARPGVRVRDMVSEGENQESYWRFEGRYFDQNGVGTNGDQPNDFKFQFGGAVYRAPAEDFFYYGAYGSLWVGLPKNDLTGTRVMPPFQGNAGGPSGGPIMTLKGEDIDMFFHPTGTRPGSILEVGQTVSLSGQIAPTLPSQVSITVTSPSNQVTQISGQANKVGYYFDPEAQFRALEPGIWTVKINVWHDGLTSAGPTQAPFPKGAVLGASAGEFTFYVVETGAPPLTIIGPEQASLRPASGAVPFTAVVPEGWVDVSLQQTTVMPGFLLEQGTVTGLVYHYDAPSLAVDFPNLDLRDREGMTASDMITISLFLSGKDANGKTVHRARQLLLQGERPMSPQQTLGRRIFDSGFE